MLNPFRYRRSVAIGATDNSALLGRLETIIPVFPDAAVATWAGNRLTFRRAEFRGLFRTIGSGAFELRDGGLHVDLSLRPFEAVTLWIAITLVDHLLRDEPRLADAASIGVSALLGVVFTLVLMRAETRRWTRQVVGAALGRPPRDLDLRPDAAHTTATAPELSSASV